jgi:hypothetical protein
MEFWQFPHSDDAFKTIHDVLKSFDCRFHWGKENPADRAYVKSRYEKWDAFARVRDEWDPARMFLNPYLSSFFPPSQE